MGNQKHHILILGAGSIGQRHLQCFMQTGLCQVSICDSNADLVADIGKKHGVAAYTDLDEALATGVTAVVICTPAQTHIPLGIRCLEAGCHILMEKPLAVTEDRLDELQDKLADSDRVFHMAYVHRNHPCVRRAYSFIQENDLGPLGNILYHGGQHFPTFRPAYREIYYNNHATGGGAIQDCLTHFFDLMQHLAGPITEISCLASHRILPGVEVEDTVTAIARHGDALATYSLNQFQAPNENTIQLNFERGSVLIEIHRQRWAYYLHGKDEWVYEETPLRDRNHLFQLQAETFIRALHGDSTWLGDLASGIHNLKVNRAALESSQTRISCEISGITRMALS